jgi:hypothetical protein
MRKKVDWVTVQCVLTDEEKAQCASQLAQAVSDKKQKEGEMETFRSQNKAEVTAAETKINLFAEKVNTGREFRSIECSIEYDFDKKIKTWFRKDTGEIVKDDIISESELQEEAAI